MVLLDAYPRILSNYTLLLRSRPIGRPYDRAFPLLTKQNGEISRFRLSIHDGLEAYDFCGLFNAHFCWACLGANA